VISVHKTAGFMFINWISKMVWDNESYEAEALSHNSYEDEGGFEDEPGMSHLQPDRLKSRGHALSSSFSSNASDKNFSEWAISRGPNTIHFAVEMVLWLHRSVVHAIEGVPGSKKAMKRHI